MKHVLVCIYVFLLSVIGFTQKITYTPLNTLNANNLTTIYNTYNSQGDQEFVEKFDLSDFTVGSNDLIESVEAKFTSRDYDNNSASVTLVIYDDNGGVPGAELISENWVVGPFINSQQTLTHTLASPVQVPSVFYVGIKKIVGDSITFWHGPTGCSCTRAMMKESGNNWREIKDRHSSQDIDFYFSPKLVAPTPVPVADFTFSQTSVNTTEAIIEFTDTSSDPVSWDWSFDDATLNSTVQNPSHTFEANGTYNVCLEVTNSAGSNSKCKDVIITLGTDGFSDLYNSNVNLRQNEEALVIESNENIESVSLYSITGSIIYTNKGINKKIVTIDIHDLNGYYILDVNGNFKKKVQF